MRRSRATSAPRFLHRFRLEQLESRALLSAQFIPQLALPPQARASLANAGILTPAVPASRISTVTALTLPSSSVISEQTAATMAALQTASTPATAAAPTLLESLVGRPRPGIDQISLHQWELDLQQALLNHAPIARATTYFFAVDGNDANPGTIDAPKKNLSAAQAIIDAWIPNAGGLRIRFLNHGRYSITRPDGTPGGLDTALLVSKPNVTISADNTQFYYTHDDLNFYSNGNFSWAQSDGATFTYQSDLPAWVTAMGNLGHGLGWLFEDNSLRRTTKPYTLCYSAAEVETHEGSFYLARGQGANGTDRLYVHIWSDATFQGSYNPSSDQFHLGWIPTNEASVVRLLPGSDGSRVDGFDCIGFGVDPVKGKTGGFAVASFVTGTDFVVISHVSAFYASSKVIVMESDGAPGGGTAFINCQAGFCGPNPGGQVTFNGYNGFGGHSFVCIGCTSYEALPTTGVQTGAGNGSFGGHANGGSTIAEILIMDCVADSATGLRYPNGTAFQDVAGPADRTAWNQYTAIVDNFTVVKGMAGASHNIAYLNCFDGAAGVAGIASGIHINEVFSWVSSQDSGPTTAAWFSDAAHDAWLFNCTIATHGPFAFNWNLASPANSTGIRVFNSIFENLLSFDPQNQLYWNANLGAGEVDHNAVYNIATSVNVIARGYTGDPSMIVMSHPVSPLAVPTSDDETYQSAISGLGGFTQRYDRFWHPRTVTPSMGAVDTNPILLAAPYIPDANLDGKVDAFDLNAIASDWQATSNTSWAGGDFVGNNGLPDGQVNAFDLNAVATYWQYGY